MVASITFHWVDKEDKHCDAKKDKNFIYLLPLG
jgi:hypothetical protein